MVPSKANEDFLIANAHAKINLHLEVLGIRSDGFHELAMVMQSINLSDQLKMIKIEDNNNGFAATQLLVENGGRDFKVTAPQDTIFVQGSTESARIDSNGNLNLGDNPTNTYGYKLNIQDNQIFYAQTASSSGTELKLY